MSNENFRQDENRVNVFCATRGLGAEVRSYLLSKVHDRNNGFDALERCASRASEAYRFTPVSDQQMEAWVASMDSLFP